MSISHKMLTLYYSRFQLPPFPGGKQQVHPRRSTGETVQEGLPRQGQGRRRRFDHSGRRRGRAGPPTGACCQLCMWALRGSDQGNQQEAQAEQEQDQPTLYFLEQSQLVMVAT